MGLSEFTRFVQFACVLGLFGTAAWHVPLRGGLELESKVPEPHRPLAVYAAGALLGFAATIGWLFAEAKTIAGSWSAIGAVISSTRFGQVATIRAALLLASIPVALFARRSPSLWRVLSALTAVAMVSFVWTGHGTAGVGAGRSLHILADALHLFCAALWIGALVMLSVTAMQAFTVKNRYCSVALLAALLRFSAVGPALVGLLIVTGFINTWLLVGPGHWGQLLRQPYGWALTAKLAVFVAMLVLAFQHRYRSTPTLRQALASDQHSGGILGSLRTTLLVETLLAALILVAVAVLGNLEPPASLS